MAGVRINPPLSFLLFLTVDCPKFSGHVAVPSLARDMIDPTQFDRMIDTAFVIATSLYGVIGIAGTSHFC